jgi:hypothetical protein
MFDPVGPNVGAFAATPSATHARTYRQNFSVVGKALYRHLRFVPTLRPAAENEQMCNAIPFNAPDRVPSPLHATHFCHRRYYQRAIENAFSAVSDCLCRFLECGPADVSRTVISKMSINCAFFRAVCSLGSVTRDQNCTPFCAHCAGSSRRRPAGKMLGLFQNFGQHPRSAHSVT